MAMNCRAQRRLQRCALFAQMLGAKFLPLLETTEDKTGAEIIENTDQLKGSQKEAAALNSAISISLKIMRDKKILLLDRKALSSVSCTFNNEDTVIHQEIAALGRKE